MARVSISQNFVGAQVGACFLLFFEPHSTCIPTSSLPMQFNGFNNYDDLDQGASGPPSPSLPPLGFDTDESHFGEFSVDTLRVPRPFLRSRPAMDFSGQHPSLPSSRPPSHMSGSTLHSTSNPSFARKAVSNNFYPQFSPEAIATLTVSELYHNPHFRKLRQQYDYVSGALAMYRDRERAESRAASCNALVPDIHQGPSSFSPYMCIC